MPRHTFRLAAALTLLTIPVGTALCSGGWRRRSSSSQRAEQERLARIASAVDEGSIDDFEKARVNQVGGENAATYGEITPRGLASLATRLRLGPSSRFADLGSGVGAAVLRAASEYDMEYACGVELAASRHARAVERLQRAPLEVASRVRFVLGDCAGDDTWLDGGPLSTVTHVWIASLLYSPELMTRLARRLSSAESSSVRAIATLRRFPDGVRGFVEEEPPEPCEMSWTARIALSSGAGADDEWAHPGSPVYIYRRQTADDGTG